MKWFGFFEESLLITENKSHIEQFVDILTPKLALKQGEADLVVMQHVFKVHFAAENKFETIKSTLISTGEKNGRSAMSKLVGTPTAIAT